VSAGALFAQTPPATAPKASAPAAAKPSAAGVKPAAKAPAAKPASPSTAAKSVTPDGKVVLTIGDEKITDKEFDNFIDGLPENLRAQARGAQKRQVAEQYVRVKLLAKEARQRSLDKDKTLQARINFQVENILAAAAYNDLQSKAPVDEAALRKYYSENKAEFEGVQARHILIKFKGSPVPSKEGKPELTEEQALAKATEIKKKLAGGEDFAKLAKEESDDSGSGANGGDLGTFKKGQMVPAFDQAVFSLPVGQVSDPVKTQFGYHLIQVQKKVGDDFAELKPQLEQRVKPEAAREAVEDLRKKATVTFDDSYFGPEQKPEPKASLK
jgi:parvulin-like peptidyl-prolyl isomerase